MSRKKKTAAEKDMRRENGKVDVRKKLSALFATVLLTSMCWANVAFASSYAENAYNNFFKDNLLWIAVLVIIGVIILSVVKKNYVGMVGTLIIGGVILFFINSPEKLKDIGNVIGNSIFG